MSGNAISRDRSVRLFNFLSELAQLSAKVTRTWQDFEKVMWLDEAPKANEVRRMAWREGEQQDKSEIWLEIKKPPELKPPPKVPAALIDCVKTVEIKNSELEEPSFINSTDPSNLGKVDLNEGPFHNVRQKDDSHAEIEQVWKDYLTDKWRPWAAASRRLSSLSCSLARYLA